MEKRTARIIELLEKEYPKAKGSLRFANPLELLVSTILSAQCTDARVNMVTQQLFNKYKNAADYATADVSAFEQDIRSTGFYHNKAKNIIAAARMIVKEFKSNVPDTMEDLILLPGVARKTANIVLTGAFGKIEGIAVDTHVSRLSQRLGLSSNKDPVKIEQDLMAGIGRAHWGRINHLLVEHGRLICGAKKPRCNECVLGKLCPSKRIFSHQKGGE
ncbi:MAG: endonuclease III [Candidatus Omnitrophica bacterium]|jgi:endonuclease-3|nr:endonuclease III [Candidatus Omnitrophota bacterium]